MGNKIGYKKNVKEEKESEEKDQDRFAKISPKSNLVACENIRFSSLFAAGDDVPPRETSPVAKSEEKRMFSQATNLGTYVKTKKLLSYIQLAENYALGVANPI